jgi:hypothetical protein
MHALQVRGPDLAGPITVKMTQKDELLKKLLKKINSSLKVRTLIAQD